MRSQIQPHDTHASWPIITHKQSKSHQREKQKSAIDALCLLFYDITNTTSISTMKIESIINDLLTHHGPVLAHFCKTSHTANNDEICPTEDSVSWRSQLYQLIGHNHQDVFGTIKQRHPELECLMVGLIILRYVSHASSKQPLHAPSQRLQSASYADLWSNLGTGISVELISVIQKNIPNIYRHIDRNQESSSTPRDLEYIMIFSALLKIKAIEDELQTLCKTKKMGYPKDPHKSHHLLMQLPIDEIKYILLQSHPNAAQLGTYLGQLSEHNWTIIKNCVFPLHLEQIIQGEHLNHHWRHLLQWSGGASNQKHNQRQQILAQTMIIQLCKVISEKIALHTVTDVDLSILLTYFTLHEQLQNALMSTRLEDVDNDFKTFMEMPLTTLFSESEPFRSLWGDMSDSTRDIFLRLVWQFQLPEVSDSQQRKQHMLVLANELHQQLDNDQTACHRFFQPFRRLCQSTLERQLDGITEEMMLVAPINVSSIYQTLRKTVWPSLTTNQQATWKDPIIFTLHVGTQLIHAGIEAHRQSNETSPADPMNLEKIAQQLTLNHNHIHRFLNQTHIITMTSSGLQLKEHPANTSADCCPSPAPACFPCLI